MKICRCTNKHGKLLSNIGFDHQTLGLLSIKHDAEAGYSIIPRIENNRDMGMSRTP
jgi:hypothetical protein